METFTVRLKLRAECKADAEELIQDYTGSETDVEILGIEREGTTENHEATLDGVIAYFENLKNDIEYGCERVFGWNSGSISDLKEINHMLKNLREMRSERLRKLVPNEPKKRARKGDSNG